MRPLRTPVGLLFCRSQTSASLLAYGRIFYEVDGLAQATLAVACLQGVFTPIPTFPRQGGRGYAKVSHGKQASRHGEPVSALWRRSDTAAGREVRTRSKEVTSASVDSQENWWRVGVHAFDIAREGDILPASARKRYLTTRTRCYE